MEFKRTLVFLLTCQLNCVLAASECTAAIIASVFGTIGALLFIAAIAALIWYCCKHRQSASLSSTSSAESINDPGFPLNGKSKGGDVGLHGDATVTFSHHYSEKAPSRAYNTSGAFDMDYSNKGDVILDMDEPASIKSPDYKGDVKIDLDNGSSIKKPSGSGDVKLDFDLDSRHALVFPSTSGHSVDLPNVKPSGRGLPGSDVDVTINGASKPMFDGAAAGETDLDIKEVFLERPGNGGFGLLIARDKTLPPPALFIREVTPGGIAANTGLVNKGDKILGINGVSIEGIPHEKAMGLLHDDTRPLLNLKLLKNAMIMDKDRLINLPGGLMEESCTVDVEPPVEASLPSVQLEALQGDAPDFGISVTEPNAGTSRRSLDVTDRNLEMRGPSVGLPKDDGKLHTPSAKGGRPLKSKNIANCFSCAGGTKKDEPYRKRKGNTDFDSGGPNSSMEMKAGREFDVSGPGAHLPGTESKMKGGKFGAGASSSDLDFNVDGSNLDVEEGPKVDMDVNAPGVTSPKAKLDPDYPNGKGSKLSSLSTRLNLPSSKKQLGNCFTCTGAKDKDEPYGNTPGNAGYASSGPKRDGSFQMKDISKPNISTNGADVDAPDTEVNLNVDTTSSQIRKPKTKAGLGWSSPKRKGGNCFSCAAGAEKDEPYQGKREKAALELKGPEFDGSLQPSTARAALSGPDVDTNRPELNVDNGDFEGPAVDVEGRKFTAKGSTTAISGPGRDGPDVDIATGMSGPEFDAKCANIKTNFSEPESDPQSGDLRGPKASLGKPSAKFGLPSIKKTRPNCFSCAGGADKDEPYLTAKGQTFDPNIPDVDGSMKPSDISAGASGPGSKVPRLGMNVAKPDADFSGPDADIQGPKVGVSGPDFDAGQASLDISGGMSGQASADLRGPKASLHKPSAELDLPSIKKRRPNCFSCAGGADKDEPYLTAKGQTFDPSIPDVDGSMKPGDISAGTSRPGGEVPRLGMNVAKPDADFSGPDADIQGPEVGVSGPNIDAEQPHLTISGPDADIQGPEVGVSGPGIDAGQASLDISAGTSGQASGDLRGPKASPHKPSAKLGLPSIKKGRPNCFSCAGGADKDEPYLTAKGQTFDPNIPDVDGSMKPGDISAGTSRPGGEVPRLGMNVAKPDADFSGPDADIQGPEVGVSGPNIDAEQPHLDISGPDADIQGPEVGVSGPDIDAGQASLDISAGTSGQVSSDLRGPKASLHKPSAELDLPSTKKRRPNCFSCAGGADKDEPYLTAKGQTFAPNIPDIDGSMKPGDISAGTSRPGGEVPRLGMNVAKPDADFSGPDADIQGPEVGVSGPNIDAGQPRLDISGPDADVQGPQIGVSGPDFDAGQASLDISAGTSGQASGDLRGPKASLHKPSAKLGLPSIKKGRPNCFSCAGGADKDEPYLTAKGQTFDPNIPDVDGSMKPGDISAGTSRPGGEVPRLGMNVAKPDADFSGPDADIQGPEVGVSGPNIDAEQPHLDISGPDADIQGPEVGVSGPDIDAGQASLDISAGTSGQVSSDLRGPKASLHKPSAELDLPSTKKRRPNCFSCAGGADKDEPYLTAKGQTFAPNIPDIDGSMKPGDISAGTSRPGGEVPRLGMNVAKPDADFSGPDADIQGPEVGVSGPNIDAEQPHLDISGPDADIQGPEVGVSGPGIDAGQASLDISAGTSGQASGDLRGPKASPHKPSAKLGLPSIKKGRPNCFSCAGGADKDEPYLTAKGQTFDPSIPDVDGSMKPGDISAGTSRPGGEVPRLGMNVAKPDADFSGPDADIQGPEVGVSGPNIDAGQPRLDVSGPDADVQGPQIGVSGPDFDAGQASLDISAGTSGQASGDLRGPKASLHKPSAKLGLPSIKKGRPNCFSCAGGADKDEPYLTAKGQTFDPTGPDVDGSMKPGDMNAGASRPGGKVPQLGMNVGKPDADFSGPDAAIQGPEVGFSGSDIDAGQPRVDVSGPDADIQGPEVGVSGPDVEGGQANLDISAGTSGQQSRDLRGPKASLHKPSAELGVPSIKKRRPNCFSCAGGADKDEPYLTAKGQTFDPNIPDVGGLMQPGNVNVTKPDADFSGPDADIRGPKGGASGPEFDISAGSLEPGLDIRGSKPVVDVEGEVEVSTTQPVEAVNANFADMDLPDTGMNIGLPGPDVDLSAGKLQGPKVASDKPSVQLLGDPSGKKRRANCFSCTGGADKDDPYITAKGGPTFDLNGPEVDGSMQPSTISADASGPQVSADGLKMDVGKPDFEISPRSPGSSGPVIDVQGPKFDVQEPKTGISGPEVDLSHEADGSVEPGNINTPGLRMNADLSGPDVNIRGPIGSVSTPDDDIKRPNLDISARTTGPGLDIKGSQPSVDNGGELELMAEGPKASVNANVPEVDASVTITKTDFSRPDLDSASGDLKGPDASARKPSAELGLPSIKKKRPNCFSCAGGADRDEPYITTKGKTSSDFSGPEIDESIYPGDISAKMDVSEGDMTGFDVDANVPRASVPSANLDVSHVKEGMSEPEPSQFDIAGPGAGISGSNIDAKGPKIGVTEPDLGATGGDPKISKLDLDVSGPTGKPNVGLDTSVETPEGKLSAKSSSLDVPKGNIKDPKATGDMSTAELSMPSGKLKGGNCFSCATSPDKDEPYRKTKGKAPFSLQGPDSNLGGQRDFSGTLPSIDSGKNLDAEGDVPGIELTTGGSIDGLDASISKPKEIEETDIPSGNIKGPSVSGRLPSTKKMRANCLSCGPDAEIDVPYGKRSGSIDLEGPKTDGSLNLKGGEVPELRATSPKLDLSPDLDLQTSKLDMSKGEEKLEVELNKPSFQIKSLDLPGASVGTKDTKLDIGQPGLDTDTSLGILGPKGTIDLDFNLPDDDLSATKPSMDKKEFGINVGTPHFGARKPDFDFSGKELEIEQSIGGSLDIDANFPDVNVQGRKPRLAMQETEMDPTDLNFDPNINPEGKASFKPAGSTFDSKFDGSLKNLTPKLRGRDTTLEHETRPLDGDIVVANDINLELQSTPEPFPSLDCQEPPSLQRHKIHSDMDLNVTPTPTEKPFSSGFNTGLDTDGSPSPTKTFNLNLGKSQKVKVELPKGKASEGKRDSSSSSSSSSSSESDSSSEDRPKKEKKKKSKSFKAFGKGSAGLASPKQGIDEIKKKGKDPSEDVTGEAPELKNKENSSKPIESSFSLPGTAVSGGMEMKGKGKVPDVKDTKSTDIPQSDVSLDADASFNLFLQDKVKEAKEGASSSSSSSSDEEDNDEADKEKKTKSKKKKKKKKWSLFGLLRKNSTSSESSKNDAAEQKDKEKESSSSSSSDEDEKKKKQQKDDTEQSKSGHTSADPQVPKKFGNSNSSKLYQVEYFTNQQKYIIETPEPVVDVADYKGDGAQIPAVESRHTDTFITSMKDASGGKLLSLSQDSRPSSHAKFTTAQEPSVVVVSRSLRKTEPQSYFGWTIDDHPEPQDANIHQTEPPVEGAYQLEYPYKAPLVKSTGDNQVQEARIAPTAKLTPNISFEVEPNDKAPEDEEGKRDFAYTRENRFAPTWHLKSYFSQTEYRVAAPEKPVIDIESSDIQEDIPIVVRRFTKQISDTDGDQGESGQFVAISTNIVSSEPSSGFELEYPGAGKMFSTDSRAASRTTDEEWIVANSFQKEKPDVAGLKASLNQLEEKTPPRRTESTGNEESKAISPSEKSSTNIPTRGSNSRLRELMQGYLIETPVLDDDETETPSEKPEEQKKGKAFEDENSEVNPERTVFNVTLKSSKFETIHVPMQFDDKDITSVSRTDVASEVKVEFEGAVSGKKPDAGYKTEYSLPVSKDDDQDDPWMRHYSKGLQSRGFSFSKVPHVKEIKPNADEETTTTTTTTTTRQTSEKRFQTETVSFQISKEKTSKSNEDLEQSSAKSLRSFWDN
ncbi:neuroblast differentiation-associated protein AHNAK-like [Acropora millepora]|uniref:neuroblast differentiation-associated protein AHNAK-like n=1 Tax=Acropora millepora TaxID=45264 RepID=UPI001CF3A579|nr:neuroblast differentiation-associated protein AHNAK-like [Acropora millepora]